MSRRSSVYTFARAVVLLAALPCLAQDSPYRPGPGRYPRFTAKQAEPGVMYGSVAQLPLPRTILYSVGADELVADAEAWTKLGFGAFFITGVAPDWSSDIWGTDGEPWTVGAADKNWQAVRKATERCRKFGAETFLTMAFSHTFDWFDDLAWQKIESNFRQFAAFAKTSGCTGVAIDIEYVWQQYHFNWTGYDYAGYTRADLVAKVRARATQIARAIYDAFPEAPLLTFPESGFSLGIWIQAAWIEEAAKRGAPGGVHLCAEGTYRRPNIRFMLGHAWLSNRIVQATLSERAREYWRTKCSIAEGLWPFGADAEDYHGAAPSPDECRQAFAASLMAGSRYNWVYSHDARARMLGRDTRPVEGQAPVSEYMPILTQRKVATNPAFVRVAHALRRMELRDYSRDLGLVIVPTLAGPREELEVGLMPAGIYTKSAVASIGNRLWDIGTRILEGKSLNLHTEFATQTEWLLLGPFDNTDKRGYAAAYPPESRIDLAAEYEGVSGRMRWTAHREAPSAMSVNLAAAMKPTELVCAYALCYVHADSACKVQIRVGANDTWKLWVNGRPAYACPDEGRIILDREIVPVSLHAGSNPILLKVCNNRKDWGFVFRITDRAGKPVPGLRIGTKPE
jgi:hypothetical protein